MEQNNGPSHGNGYGDVPVKGQNGVGLGFAWTMDVLDLWGIPCKTCRTELPKRKNNTRPGNLTRGHHE